MASQYDLGRWFPPDTPVSSTRKLISSSLFHHLDITLAVAGALNPNTPNQTQYDPYTRYGYLRHLPAIPGMGLYFFSVINVKYTWGRCRGGVSLSGTNWMPRKCLVEDENVCFESRKLSSYCTLTDTEGRRPLIWHGGEGGGGGVYEVNHFQRINELIAGYSERMFVWSERNLSPISWTHSIHDIIGWYYTWTYSIHDIIGWYYTWTYSIHDIIGWYYTWTYSIHDIIGGYYTWTYSIHDIIGWYYTWTHSIHDIIGWYYTWTHSIHDIIGRYYTWTYSIHDIIGWYYTWTHIVSLVDIIPGHI